VVAVNTNLLLSEELEWECIDSFENISENELIEIRNLLTNEAGVNYSNDLLKRLPLSLDTPNLLLKINNQIIGVFASLALNSHTVRILAFAIDSKFQRRGLGKKCWEVFISQIKRSGFKDIQLEVKSSNENAISFYEKKGMKITGKISNYYKEESGYLMLGKY